MKNLSKYLFFTLIAVLLPLYVMAIQSGDIITISITVSGTTTCLKVNDAGNGYDFAQSNNLTAKCLWLVGGNGTNGYTLRNVSTNQYLRVGGNRWGRILELGNSAASFGATNFGNSSASITSVFSYNADGTTYYIRQQNNNAWYCSLSNSNSTAYTVHKWVQENGSFTGPVFSGANLIDGNSIHFAYDASSSQAFNIDCTLRTGNRYIDQAPSNRFNDITTGTSNTYHSIADLQNNGITINITTPSTPSSLTQLQYATSTYNTNYKRVQMTPVTNSRTLGVSELEEYVDVEIVSTRSDVVLTEAQQHSRVRVSRDAYTELVGEVDKLYLYIEPSSYWFAYNAISAQIEFTVYASHITGDVRMINGVPIGESGENMQVIPVNLTSSMVSLHDGEGMPIDWASITSVSGNKVIVTCDRENMAATARIAELAVAYEYTCTEMTHHATSTVEITQGSQTAGASLILHHQKGKTNSPLVGEDGHQQTHEVYKTLYYIPNTLGSNTNYVRMVLKEGDFRGWHRWYDYDTRRDVSAVYSSTIESHDTQWRTAPSGGGTRQFTVIGSGSSSQGRYKYNLSGKPNTVEVYSYSDNQTHHIACDVSNYTDYEVDESDGQITEPTLSYREIFKLRPADDMVAKMNRSRTEADYWVEDYTIIAPSRKTIPLSPEYFYKNGDDVFKCYIYRDGGVYRRVGASGALSAAWTMIVGDGAEQNADGAIETSTDQYRVSHTMVSSDLNAKEKVVYMLKAGSYKLCRFTVIFQPIAAVGPMAETVNDAAWSGSAIQLTNGQKLTKEYIYDHYMVLDSLNFNYNSGSASTTRYYYTPLAWDEHSSGFTFDGSVSEHRSTSGPFPYWGEYVFTNRTRRSEYNFLVNINQHGGADAGYMMYVDGTQDPGIVATLSVTGHLCSGQQMYCCAWIANVGTNGGGDETQPKFRFVIEGKNADQSEWTEVASYLSGAIEKSSNDNGTWYQVNFGIDLQDDYDNYRITVYNYASSTTGNDFAIDDIYIYASRPPLVAYQATTNCQATNTEIQVVLRLDYGGLSGEWDDEDIYYDVWNESKSVNVPLTPYPLGYPDNPSNTYGKVRVPASINYNPLNDNVKLYHPTNNPSGTIVDASGGNYEDGFSQALKDYITAKHAAPEAVIFNSVKDLMDSHTNIEYYYVDEHDERVPVNTYLQKAYVKEEMGVDTRYVIYIVHNALMQAEYDYSVRMSADPTEFESALCAMHTPVPVSNKVTIELDGSVMVQTTPLQLCANDMYNVGMRVTDISYDIEHNTTTTLEGHCYNDWLKAPVMATCTGTAEEIAACEAAQEPTRGIDVSDANTRTYYDIYDEEDGRYFTMSDIINAITYDMRSTRDGNTNINAKNLSELDPSQFTNSKNYQIIVNLVNRGLLDLYEQAKDITMPAGAPDVAYVVLPIAGSATMLNSDEPLDVCVDPVYVHLKVQDAADYDMSIGKVPPSELPDAIKNQVPIIRASQDDANHQLSITLQQMRNVVIGPTIKLVGSNDPDWEDGTDWFAYYPDRTYVFNGDNPDYYQADNNEKNTIVMTAYGSSATRPTGTNYFEMHQGYKYTFQMPLLSYGGAAYINNGCPFGNIFFQVYVVPDYVAWIPGLTEDNNWNNDDNWRIVDANGNPLPGQGFVPKGHTNVIIENAGDNDSYPMLVPYSELEADHELVTYDFNYEATHCKNILFRKNAMLLNQHLLRYEKAYVDATFPGAYWTLFSSPIDGVVSGDMFSPQPTGTADGTWELTQYGSTGGHRSAKDPYCYWMSLYEQTTNLYNIGEGAGVSDYKESYQAGWSKLANDIAHPFAPGDAVAVLGYGPEDEYGEECTVRLPKADRSYSYWRNDADEEYGAVAPITRPSNYDDQNLAFHEVSKTYTLTTKTAGNDFVFGNPTMAYIDMAKFFEVNTDFSTTFYTLYQNGWSAVDCSNARINLEEDTYYLEPLRGVMLRYTGTAKTSVTVTVTKDMLTLAGYEKKASTSTEEGGGTTSAPGRRKAKAVTLSCLKIYAEAGSAASRLSIWEDPRGNDGYDESEDAMLMLSGVTSFDNAAVYSDLAICSLADDKMLSIDVRKKITQIPIMFSDLGEFGEVDLWFDGASTFGYTLYFVDALTEETWEIIDGTHLHLQMPQDGSVRYYIRAEEHKVEEQGGPATNTGEVRGNSQEDENHVDFISNRPGQVTILSESAISSIECFDLAGRLIRTIDGSTMSSHNLVTISLPQGANLVRVNNAKGSVTGKLLIK